MDDASRCALVVNDNHVARWALGQALTRAGFAVNVAHSAESALEKLAGLDRLDAVVASLSVGSEAVNRLQNAVGSRWPAAAIVLLATDVDAQEPADAGTRAMVLDTPFSVEDIVAAARRAVPVDTGR